jgi:hypothetical protein
MPWYLASTIAGREYYCRDRLIAAGITVLVPTWKRLIKPRHTRKPRISERPLFPRIVMLETEDLGHDRLVIRERTAARLWFATYQDVVLKERRYVIIRDSEVETLRARVASGEFDRLASVTNNPHRVFAVGDHIKFQAGALIDRTGIVAAKYNGAKYRVDIGPLSVIAGAEQIVLTGVGA